MSGPFSAVSPNGKPSWSSVESTNGGFSLVDALGGIHTAEVGYDETDSGYGDEGYDAPAINIPGVAQPLWTVETTK